MDNTAADVLAMVDDVVENVTCHIYRFRLMVRSTKGPVAHAAYTLTTADLNGDQEPDFIVPSLAEAECQRTQQAQPPTATC